MPFSLCDRRAVDGLAGLERSLSTPRGARPQTYMNGRVFGNIPAAELKLLSATRH